MKLEAYAKIIATERNILSNSIRILNTDATTVVDVANIVKALEIGNIRRTDEFELAMSTKTAQLSESITTSSEDLLYLARSMQDNTEVVSDLDNIDIEGNIVMGQRTLEDFGDKVLESYYREENK